MDQLRENDPPTRLWKLAVLLAATFGLYLFAWLPKVARDLRASRDAHLTPWHWALVPLLGPLMAIPFYYLANSLREWQEESGAKIGHFAEPVLVSMLTLVAFLPLYLMIINLAATPTFAAVTILMLFLPCLALQGQINLIKRRARPSEPSARLTRPQLAAIVGGALISLPLYIYTFTNVWQHRSASVLSAGDVIAPAGNSYKVRIGDDGWSQLAPGYLSEDSDLEFLGPDDRTWAIVYDSTGLDVDTVMMNRIGTVRSEYRSARCSERKSLVPDSLVVLGAIICTGRNALIGDYVVAAKVLGDRSRVIEIVASTSQTDRVRYDSYMPRVLSLADGLELVP